MTFSNNKKKPPAHDNTHTPLSSLASYRPQAPPSPLSPAYSPPTGVILPASPLSSPTSTTLYAFPPHRRCLARLTAVLPPPAPPYLPSPLTGVTLSHSPAPPTGTAVYCMKFLSFSIVANDNLVCE